MVFLLAKAYQKAHGEFKKRLIPYELTNLQHLVLESLWYHQGQTASELGRLLTLDKATLSGILDRMVKAEWIIKKPNEKDRRQMTIHTARRADDLKQELIDQRIKANNTLLEPFTPEEAVLLKRLLIDIVNA